MSRRAQATSPSGSSQVSPDVSGEIEFIEPGADDMDESALVFPEFGPDMRVRILRLDDLTKKWITHGHQLNRDFTRETVLGMFGGGRYFCQVLTENSAILRGAKFTLPGAYRPTGLHGGTPSASAPSSPTTPEPTDPPRPAAPRADPTPVELIERVMTSRFLETLSGATSRPTPSPWAPVLAAMAPAIVTALPELFKVLRGPATRTDPALAAELASLRTMLEQQQRNAGGVASPNNLDTFKQFLELQELLRDGGDRDSGRGGGMLERLAEIAAAMMQKAATPAAPTSAPRVEVTTLATIPNASTAPVHEQFLMIHANNLTRAAAHNMEPQGVAALVMAELPQSEHGILAALVGREDAADEILRVVPSLAPYSAWVAAVVEEFRERFGVATVDDGGEE